MAVLEPGSPVKPFSVQDQDGREVTHQSLKGKWTILYFYPRDLTPGCTVEACDFRDNFGRISNAGAVVLGVSKDSAKSHRNFREKKELPFDLLVDGDGSLCESFGVWQSKKFMGRVSMGIVRSTFLIDPKGVVRQAWSPVSVKGHVEAVLQVLQAQAH